MRLPNINNEVARNMIFYNGIKMYNQLPIDIRKETNIRKFKTNGEKYVIENYDVR